MARIGEKLFFDKRLSVDGGVSCSSCHSPEKAFSDGRAVAVGVHGQPGVRNTPSLMGISTATAFSWDGRHAQLEAQVIAPLLNPREHGFASPREVVAVVERSTDYPARFRSDVSLEAIASALSTYVRSLDETKSRFDRYWFGKERNALSEDERRGLEIFVGPGKCATCHELNVAKASFTDGQFHAVGLTQLNEGKDLAALALKSVAAKPVPLELLVTSDAGIAALGRFNVTRRPADIGKYRTPTLRNVAITAPYMHDGSVATLEEAVDVEIYYRGLEQRRPLLLTAAERRNLVSFLRALTAESLEKSEGSQR